MKKNGILTLLFALIPGAGEMYQGYMKRGLSIITMFCLSIALSAWMGIEIFYIGVPILYMYSFFDTLICGRRSAWTMHRRTITSSILT